MSDDSPKFKVATERTRSDGSKVNPGEPGYEHASQHAEELTPALEILQLVVDDYDRRREHWWGRLLLWLLRKTT